MESVDLLGHVNMVAVGDVVFVRDALDDAEALLQALGKLVGRGLHGCAVDGVADALRGPPLRALVVQALHDLEAELTSLIGSVGFSCHAHAHLIKTRIAKADGAVVVKEQAVDLLALFEAGDGAVLPQDGSDVGDSPQQSLVAAAQGAVAELQAFLQNLPELVHIPVGGAGDVDQVDGDNTLVETSVILVGAVFTQAHGIGCQEGPAAHAGVDIAVFVLLHHLGGDVVGDHALGSAFGCQLGEAVISGTGDDIVLIQHINEFGESRSDPDALFVLDALHTLDQDFLDQHGQVVACAARRNLVQIHEHGNERSLTVAGHQGDQLVLDGLDTALDFLCQTELNDLVDDGVVHGLAAGFALFDDLLFDLGTADINEGSQMGQREGLTAVLVGGDLGHDLGGHVAGGVEAVGSLDQGLTDDCAVLQHVFQIDEVTVMLLLGIIIRIVEMDDAFFMGPDDLGGKKDASGQILGDLAGHIVTLGGIDDRILVGILLFDFLVELLDQGKDPVVGRVGLAGELAAETIADIFLCHFIAAHLHDAGLDHILDILDIYSVCRLLDFLRDLLRNCNDLILVELVDGLHLFVCLADRIDDLGEIESDLLPVSLDDIRGNCHACIFCHFFISSLYGRIFV